MKFPNEFRLVKPANHYFDDPEYPEAVEYVAARNELYDRMVNGTLYVKFIAGDRKGSIARMVRDTRYDKDGDEYVQPRASIKARRRYWNDPDEYEIDWGWFNGVCKWDKRKNSCQLTMPDADAIFLPNYNGPTIYEMFDRKAAKAELLKNPDQTDIDGNVLAIGDKVLYINARYYAGMELCHGTIQEFKVTADSKGHSFTTVVKNDEADEVSSISYPWQMIYKKAT